MESRGNQFVEARGAKRGDTTLAFVAAGAGVATGRGTFSAEPEVKLRDRLSISSAASEKIAEGR